MPQRSARRSRSKSPSSGGWQTPLTEPVELADGTTLRTLQDAGQYISGLPDRWRTVGLNSAAAALLIAKDHPSPENIVEATNRLKGGLYFNRLLKREAS